MDGMLALREEVVGPRPVQLGEERDTGKPKSSSSPCLSLARASFSVLNGLDS